MGFETRGRLVVGSLSAHARPTYGLETSQPRLGEKPSPGGLPMFFHSSVTPLRMEEKGDLRSGGVGPEVSVCLPPCRPVAGNRAQVSRPHVARGPLMAGIRSPAGVKGRLGHSPGESGRLAIIQPPGKSPAQAPGPQVFPAHTVSEELGELLGSVAHGKSRGPLGGREGSCVHGQVPRDPVQLL